MVDAKSKGESIEYFDEDSLEYLAKREHNAWYKLKVNLGWRYDAVRDEEKKLNPNLMKWDDLDPIIKDDNKRTFRNLPQMCKNVDLKIVKN